MNKHHPLRGASLFALTIAGGGCALIAGYDFDEYTLSDAGAGTTTSASSSSGDGGGGGGSSSSSSSSGSSSSSTSSSSSGSTSSSSSSSSSGLMGGMVLLGNIRCPTSVTFGIDRVHYATGLAGAVPPAGWVKPSDLSNGDISFPIEVAEIPGLAGNSSGAYAAVNNSSATPGNLFQVPPPTVISLGSVSNPIGGVALIGPNIFFTTRMKGGVNGGLYQRSIGSTLPPQQVWTGTNPHGPIAANGTHVYWTQDNTIWRADITDPSKTAMSVSGIPAGIRALAADAVRVWIGHGIGLSVAPEDLSTIEDVATDGTLVFGIVAEAGDAYFTQGETLYQVKAGSVSPKASGFIAPRGVAMDANNVYVADQGTCGSVPDGKIVKVPK